MPGPGRGNIMLKIENASKTFNPGTINEKVALDHISLILEDGDFATIVGSNGAGKSTLFNAIAGSFITLSWTGWTSRSLRSTGEASLSADCFRIL